MSSESQKPNPSKKLAEIEDKLKKKVQAETETVNKRKKKAQNIVEQLKVKQSKGFLTEKFIEDTLQGICDFMCDVQQASIGMFLTSDAKRG